jgi:DNA-binding transcriptional MerR regulator
LAKGPEAFRSISEAADALGVPQHVLRFWETKFSFIRPMKRAGGRRFYRPHDILVLGEVRRLLHEEGYTIKGVQKLHRELGAKRFVSGEADTAQHAPPAEEPAMKASDAPTAPASALDVAARQRLQAVLTELEVAKAELDRLLPPAKA